MNTNRIEWYDECAEPPWKAVERLHAMRQIKDRYKSACLHDRCSSCHGTGTRNDGLGMCVHMISCPCPKCSPR